MTWWKLQTFYGVEEPENGKHRGDCAIQPMFTDDRALQAAIAASHLRDDIGWVDVTDMITHKLRREYMR
ncbi:hypothetical protein I6F35_02835 [Bradyrhizobium sp. BRP22]|uniref:hypothetical protein n=1 Tax=Bradyrhizobium sp. BRP22 TaxID=2793821 RepID=UPI001CD5A58D|nr:hypothetical protein [Bradyrhizobium sp. BRP22]MCA1452150.1 hypothetical protein [Bradyrhizobium sp. BRP22]